MALGLQLSREVSGVVLLIGNLGAGKTTMTKGLVEGREVARAEEVSSPTFTLIHQYGDQDSDHDPIYHVDLYRLDEARQVETLGLDELFASGHLVILEWAERFPELMPAQRTEIRIKVLNDDSREIVVDSIG